MIWSKRDERNNLSGLEEGLPEMKTITVNSRPPCRECRLAFINHNIHQYAPQFTAYLSRFGVMPRVFSDAGLPAMNAKNLQQFEMGVIKSKSSQKMFFQKLESLEKCREYSEDVAQKIKENEQKIVKIIEQSSSAYQPLISVIMPTYNRADIITESILSVLEQTYVNFELIICDDGSTDNTREVIERLKDARIAYLYQENQGAAAARNHALAHAYGALITYLDIDNSWHPEYLKLVVVNFSKYPGRSAMYFDYVDLHMDKDQVNHLESIRQPDFVHESLMRKPIIHLNTFAHKRELYDVFGGFDERLKRRQDYDVTMVYTWLRDPVHVELIVSVCQRNDLLSQINWTCRRDMSCISIISRKIENFFSRGLPVVSSLPVKKVTIIIWDICRNHFSKAFSVAEALSARYEVELISFDFFDEGVFKPLEDAHPGFETKYFKGSNFPDFFEELQSAVNAITGDIMYVVKPRLPSLGLALLANYQRSIPFILEINDLETVVNSPEEQDKQEKVRFEDFDLSYNELLNPYSNLWSQLLDPIAQQVPVLVTHNKCLDERYGNGTLYMRNLKDERVYDPDLYNRDRIREDLGFNKDDRVIVFGGLLRKHKGIYELVELVERLGDVRYKLLFVGSRPTPDQVHLLEEFKETITVLPPHNREGMARINFAADLVILWLNPDVAASHYQMPYKLTDALAMKTPIIANDISDLGELGRQGYLKIVRFGDWQGMIRTIDALFADPVQTKQMCEAARRLYLRQFSFNAGISCFELAAYRALQHSCKSYPVANYFAEQFNRFYQLVAKTEADYVSRN